MNKYTFSEHVTSEVGVFRERTIRLRTGSLCSRSVLTYSEWAASVEGVLRMNKYTFSEHVTSEVGVFRERMVRLRIDSLCSRNVINQFGRASPFTRNIPKETYQKDKVRLNLQILKAA
jgi:hypothetical protein